MEVEQAAVMGFCYGVRRAINLLERARVEYGGLHTLGEVVHNRLVVERLAAQGISPAGSLAELHGPAVALTTHGIGPQVWAELKSRPWPIVDATCPWVSRAQRAAQRLAAAGFSVIIFGDADHPEVKGVLEWAGEKGRVAQEPELERLFTSFPWRLGILSQTTQSPQRFAEFVRKVVDKFLPQGIEIRVINTICDATQKRQEAALELVSRRCVEAMVVVGSRGSANTRRLAEICLEKGTPTYLVETAQELEASWFQGRGRVGVTAGASTPDEVIQEVIDKLKCLKGGSECNTISSASISM